MRLTKEEFCAAVDKFEQMCNEESKLLRALDIGAEWKPGQWILHQSKKQPNMVMIWTTIVLN